MWSGINHGGGIDRIFPGGKDEQLLRASKSFERGYENASSTRSCSPSSVTRSHHHHNHYRTLQKVNNASPTTSHQQRVEPEYAHVKRYHTTPHKDKHKVFNSSFFFNKLRQSVFEQQKCLSMYDPVVYTRINANKTRYNR